MSMTTCKDCGKPVARSAEACPHCGAFRRKRTSPVTWLMTGIIGLPLLIALVVGFIKST